MIRLSDNFILLDFLYGQAMIDCVVHCGDSLSDRIESIEKNSEEVLEGQYLCENVLERIVEWHGPISIGAGLWFKDLSEPKNAHGDRDGLGPHKWKRISGAAADIVVHSWVNHGKDAAHFSHTLPNSDIEYHRILDYPGSEFFCLASRSSGNKFKRGNPTWDRSKAGADVKSCPFGGRNEAWRREPYSHSHGSLLRRDLGYDGRLRSAESVWSEYPATRSQRDPRETVVYGRKLPKGFPLLDHSIVEVPNDAFGEHPVGGQQLCRPWHVRVSKNFVLLDFCRNERMFERKVVTVPPLTFRTANSVIKVARMFGEVLDEVKKHLGNISVVRGMEPEGFSDNTRADEHRWIPGDGRMHSVEFVTPKDPKPGYQELLGENACLVEVKRDPVYGGDRVRVRIRDFTPSRCFSSATEVEYAWSE